MQYEQLNKPILYYETPLELLDEKCKHMTQSQTKKCHNFSFNAVAAAATATVSTSELVCVCTSNYIYLLLFVRMVFYNKLSYDHDLTACYFVVVFVVSNVILFCCSSLKLLR